MQTWLLLALGSIVLGQEWTIDTDTTLTMVVGVGAYSASNAIGAASQNGIGAVMETYDGEIWHREALPAGILMDAAESDTVSVGVSFWEVLVSTDGGATYVVSDAVSGLSQSCSVFGEGSDLGLVGTFTTSKEAPFVSVSGVAHSPDAGSTWELSEVPIGWVRYGSFPSKNTWYVSSGMWGDSASTSALNGRTSGSKFSSKITINEQGHLSYIQKNNVSDASGWWGAISKTTDGGKTWNVVFHSEASDIYYFNAISCSSETHCVAVAEGDVYYAFVTFDGGETWEETLTSSGVVPDTTVSLMCADWVNDNEGWVASTSKNGRTLSGVFYKTTDGGKTYAIQQTMDNCYPIDMDFGGDLGVAACLSSSGSSGSIATYQ